MKNYKKLSLFALLSVSSIAFGYYDTTGSPSPDDFDDAAGGPILVEPGSKPTQLEQEVRILQQPTARPTNHKPTPIPAPKIPTRLPNRKSDSQIFQEAAMALGAATKALGDYGMQLVPVAFAAQEVLSNHEKEKTENAAARKWTKWQMTGVGIAGLGFVSFLTCDLHEKAQLIASALASAGGVIATGYSRTKQNQACDAVDNEFAAHQRDTLTTQKDVLEKALGTDEEYNKLQKAYMTAYNMVEQTVTASTPNKKTILENAFTIYSQIETARCNALNKLTQTRESLAMLTPEN